MNKTNWLLPAILMLAAVGGISMNADAGWFGLGGTSWKEEVLLHDGKTIIVTRSQTYGGRHEIGQSPPVKEHTITFKLSDSNTSLSWTSEYGEDLGRTNFNLLALHVLGDTPFLVAEPNLCLSYNKSGRPNPPYLVFKHDGKAWQRIQLSELPAEFKSINLIVNNGREEDIAKAADKLRYVSAADIAKLNSSLTQPQYKTIVREALPADKYGCPEMIPDGKGGWTGVGFFRDQPSYEACVSTCNNFHIDEQHCPCHRYFKKGQ